MEQMQQFFYDYGLWVVIAAAAVILILLFILTAVCKSRHRLKKQNKQLSKNNAQYSREINDLRYQNERMQAEKAQAETERQEAQKTQTVKTVAVPKKAETMQTHSFDGRRAAVEEDDEDEYEVTASFDDMQQKPPAAYSVKYDRAKGSWVIARAGQQRPVRRVATKEEALKIARELAKKTGAGLYVHKKDGKFQKV